MGRSRCVTDSDLFTANIDSVRLFDRMLEKVIKHNKYTRNAVSTSSLHVIISLQLVRVISGGVVLKEFMLSKPALF